MTRKAVVAGAVVGVLVLGLVGFGLFRQFFPYEERRVFIQTNQLVSASVKPGSFGMWAGDHGSYVILGHEACGGMLWGYHGPSGAREAWEAEWVFFVDLEERFVCPLSEAARESSREPIMECPPCAREEFERLAGLPAGSGTN